MMVWTVVMYFFFFTDYVLKSSGNYNVVELSLKMFL